MLHAKKKGRMEKLKNKNKTSSHSIHRPCHLTTLSVVSHPNPIWLIFPSLPVSVSPSPLVFSLSPPASPLSSAITFAFLAARLCFPLLHMPPVPPLFLLYFFYLTPYLSSPLASTLPLYSLYRSVAT